MTRWQKHTSCICCDAFTLSCALADMSLLVQHILTARPCHVAAGCMPHPATSTASHVLLLVQEQEEELVTDILVDPVDEEEEERRRLEESRRRRQAILAKHQQQAAVAAPTATAASDQAAAAEGNAGAGLTAAPGASPAAVPAPAEAPAPGAASADIDAPQPSSAAASAPTSPQDVVMADAAEGDATPDGQRYSSSDSENAPGSPVMDIWNTREQAAPNDDEAISGVVAAPGTEPNLQSERLKGPPAKADVDDMFADDVPDDMFAEAAGGDVAAVARRAPGGGAMALADDAYDDAEGYYNFQVGARVQCVISHLPCHACMCISGSWGAKLTVPSCMPVLFECGECCCVCFPADMHSYGKQVPKLHPG